MQTVLEHCCACVCFSEELCERALQLWPHTVQHAVVIPQAVVVESHLDLRDGRSAALDTVLRDVGVSESRRCLPIALLPGGFRPVKGQSFAVKAWESASLAKRATLLLLGPVLDENYHTRTWAECGEGVVWHDGVSHADLESIMADERVIAVLNTSESEGQPQTILEGMMIGKPVIVRRNRGNCAVVHPERGSVVSTPEELGGAVHRLLDGRSEEKVTNAHDYVELFHNVEKEAEAYYSLVDGLLGLRETTPS